MRPPGSSARDSGDEARPRGRARDRRRRPRRGRARVARLGLVGEPAARDLQRHGLRDPGRRRWRRRSARRWPGTTRKRSVADLHGPAGRAAAAVHADGASRRASGSRRAARSQRSPSTAPCPGPELRVRQGDLVEVTLRNKDVEDGVTIHWHGVDVPNAEDGVAGVTQDAVPPGRELRLPLPRRRRSGRSGTTPTRPRPREVRRGLYGALVIEPATDGAPRADGRRHRRRRPHARRHAARQRDRRRRAAGRRSGHAGAAAADQHRQHAAALRHRRHAVRGRRDRRHRPRRPDAAQRARTLVLAAGGRYDVAFTMPRAPGQARRRGHRRRRSR